MKSDLKCNLLTFCESLPSRERGLKFAPWERTGIMHSVAPFAGAWIEILFARTHACAPTSLPSRERGLKSIIIYDHPASTTVAPFAGAWIEIYVVLTSLTQTVMSLPSRERGLKYCHRDLVWRQRESLPSRERGLKSPGCPHPPHMPRRSLRGSVD